MKKIMLAAVATGLAALLTPADVGAYGAAHVGYTHVGPNGVYHTNETVTAGPGGVRTEDVRTYGGDYRGGTVYGTEYRGGDYRGGAVYGTDRVYTPAYGGAAVGGEVHYGYVR